MILFSYISLDPDAHSCVSRNNTLDEARNREQTRKNALRRDSRYRFYWSSGFYSSFLLVLSKRSAFRVSITKREPTSHSHGRETSRRFEKGSRVRGQRLFTYVTARSAHNRGSSGHLRLHANGPFARARSRFIPRF